MKKQTLKELGAILPVPHKGLAAKDFSFKPWRLEQEKLVGQLKSKHKQTGIFIRELFSVMLEKLGGQDWSTMDKSKRLLVLNQMPLGDMFYLYVWLRTEAMGFGLAMGDIKCAACGHKHKDFSADLESLEVRVKEEGDADTLEVKLRKPFKMGDVEVTTLVLGHSPWDIMEKMEISDAGNDGLVKEAMLMRSIVGSKTNQGEAKLDTHTLIQNIAKVDLEELTDAMDEHNGGPVLGLKFDCEKCGEEVARPLEWAYDYFFGNSSLPSRRKR